MPGSCRTAGLALAFTLLGTGVTAALLPSLATWLIEHYGWRKAFIGIALLPLAVGLPVAYWLFREPDDSDGMHELAAANRTGVSVRTALRDYRFWVIAVSVLCVSIGVGGSITNFQPLLIDRGFVAQDAARVAGVIGVSIIVGRLVAGFLIDRYWAPLVTLPMLALPAVACILLARPEVSTSAAVIAAMLIGLAAGAETDLVAFLTARYFGMAHYGRIYGLQYSVFGFASGISPFLFGKVFDLYGTYRPILYAAAVLFVFGAVALLSLGRYPRFEAADSRGFESDKIPPSITTLQGDAVEQDSRCDRILGRHHGRSRRRRRQQAVRRGQSLPARHPHADPGGPPERQGRFQQQGRFVPTLDRFRGAGDRQGQLHQARRHREGLRIQLSREHCRGTRR